MKSFDVYKATASELLKSLEGGQLTSEAIVQSYLKHIDEKNDYLKAVLEIAPTALNEARERDRERSKGITRGSLHGLPILIKASLATRPDLHMGTTSGNFALSGSRPRQDAEVVQHLLKTGAIILGKASLSELSYWKIDKIPAGWSPVGGQGQNAYVRHGLKAGDPTFSINGPGGSSSGPAIGVSAGFAPVAIGTETSGSLIFPADRAALYTIKPTAGIIPADGIVPVSYRFDTAGPMAKCSRDVALLLDVLVDATKTSPPLKGYTSIITGAAAWADLKVGVLNPVSWLYDETSAGYTNKSKEQIVREVSAAYETLGTKVKALKNVTFKSWPNATSLARGCDPLMGKLFEHDYRRDFESYLSTVDGCRIQHLQDILDSNDAYRAFSLPGGGSAGRENLSRAIFNPISDDEARAVDAEMREASRTRGIDGALQGYGVDVVLGPGSGPLYKIAAAAGYPIATLPLSYLEVNGCPFGLVAMAGAHQEARLVQVQAAWEEDFPKRRTPAETF